ncbi:hypothetical protein [Kineosporia sp. R_H_3]|uniref:hypothetical protein n=1 Tax=Kineosporia sp. R_H_3 TaxID=1961848 RepID=UPI000B4B68C6|nr:hypothetical protein [Kineosporia sp. R_H_3]
MTTVDIRHAASTAPAPLKPPAVRPPAKARTGSAATARRQAEAAKRKAEAAKRRAREARRIKKASRRAFAHGVASGAAFMLVLFAVGTIASRF